MEKKRYIKPCSVVIDDAGISLMEASTWRENETAPTTVSASGAYDDGIATEIFYVTDDRDVPVASANMHELWEEW